MYITADTIVLAATTVGALITLFGIIFAVYRWYLRQKQQDVEIRAIQEEQCILTYGILACLDGLEQLGCNHTVSETRNRIEKHLNKKAHNVGGEQR